MRKQLIKLKKNTNKFLILFWEKKHMTEWNDEHNSRFENWIQGRNRNIRKLKLKWRWNWKTQWPGFKNAEKHISV